MGGGSNGGTTSMPLTGWQRADAYNYGMNSIGGTTMFNQPYYQYQTPDYVDSPIYDSGDAKQMAGGDYDRLEQSIVTSRLAPLMEAYGQQSSKLDSDLAKRGIYSSGAATQAQNDLMASFLPQVTQAGADAATQRYGMQQQDLNSLNQYNLSRAGSLNSATQAAAQNANSFNMENANRQYASAWKPAEYGAGIYNGTGGTVSTTGSGWNFMI